jgi:hypothetical protein
MDITLDDTVIQSSVKPSRFKKSMQEGMVMGLDPFGTAYGFATKVPTWGYHSYMQVLDRFDEMTVEETENLPNRNLGEKIGLSAGIVLGLVGGVMTVVAPSYCFAKGKDYLKHD